MTRHRPIEFRKSIRPPKSGSVCLAAALASMGGFSTVGAAAEVRPQVLPAMDAKETETALKGSEGRALMAVWKREKFHRQLPEAERKSKGMPLLQSALALIPYNLAVVDRIVETATPPDDLVDLADGIDLLLAATDKPGCPKDGIYPQFVLTRISARLGTLPVPADRRLLARAAVILKAAGKDARAAAAKAAEAKAQSDAASRDLSE